MTVLLFTFCRQLTPVWCAFTATLLYAVHPPDGPRIWYLVDGDVLSGQGAKPDEKVVRAVLLSIAEAKPLGMQ